MSSSGRGGEEKNSQPPPGIETQNPVRPVRSPALYRLSYHGSCLLLRNSNIKIYKSVFAPVGLYGCETWSVIVKEEHGLRVFQNRVLRRISGPKREEVAGDWRKLHNEELLNLYCSADVNRVLKLMGMRWAGHVAFMGGMRNSYQI
jgi:hypothetical protein